MVDYAEPGLLNDPRPIESIDLWPHGDESMYFATSAGPQSYDKIEAYQEATDWAEQDNAPDVSPSPTITYVPWIRVWRGGVVVFRVRASSCAIRYAESKS